MKQDEEEWIAYHKVMQDVIQRSGLDKSTFYDVRGNHDNFGVPVIGGSFDFFSKYSINGQLQRSGKVNSITIQVGDSLSLVAMWYQKCGAMRKLRLFFRFILLCCSFYFLDGLKLIPLVLKQIS